MLIGNLFRNLVANNPELCKFDRLRATLCWSLARTGKGHRTDNAIIAGLSGYDPVHGDLILINQALEKVRETGFINFGIKKVPFDPETDIVWNPDVRLPGHQNGLILELLDQNGSVLFTQRYFSVGGGLVRDELFHEEGLTAEEPFPYQYAQKWMEYAVQKETTLSDIVIQNTAAIDNLRLDQTRSRMFDIWQAMKDSIERGLNTSEELLPGPLKVKRRAPLLFESARRPKRRGIFASNDICRYATAFAYAVCEENAASGRVVTAPTNGGSGVVPGVLYASQYLDDFSDDQIVEVLFTEAGIVGLIQANASISGSEVGCQCEVGAACSMAAGAVAQLFGGSPGDVEYAAEIAMEHSLGLECTPMKGYVQIPCIERNGIYAQKSLAAAQHAITLKRHRISLDLVINKMYENGTHMDPDFKETSRKGFGPIEPDID
jgi:L-serine dehydratase